MCYLSSPDDDVPAILSNEPSPTLADLHRERDYLHMHVGNVMRLLEGCRAKDGSFNRAVINLTVNGARNALENALQTLDAVEAECKAHLAERETVLHFTFLPPARPFGRRTRDADLPATVSPAGVL